MLNALEECEDIDDDGRNFLLAGRWEEELEQATKTSLQRCEDAFDGEVASLPRFGMLGGYGSQSKNTKNLNTKIQVQAIKYNRIYSKNMKGLKIHVW